MLFSNISPILYSLDHYKTSTNVYNEGPKHSIVYKLMCVLHGNCIITCNDRKYHLSKGDFFHILPNITYTTDIYDNFENINIFYNYVKPENQVIAGMDWSTYLRFDETKSLIQSIDFEDYTNFNDAFLLHDTFGGEAIIRHMLREYNKSLIFSMEYMTLLLHCLLIEIARSFGSSGKKYNTETADKVISYINKNIEEDINCTTVAKNLGYHNNYINSIIKAACGVNLHTYIETKKIGQALYLLENTNLTITEISYRLSYPSTSRFCKAFIRSVGVTPSSFRRRLH